MTLQLTDDKKGKRQLKRLLKPAQDRAIDESLQEIPDAAKAIAAIRKDMTKLKKRVKGLESTTEKLWTDKVQRDIAIAQNADNEAGNGR